MYTHIENTHKAILLYFLYTNFTEKTMEGEGGVNEKTACKASAMLKHCFMQGIKKVCIILSWVIFKDKLKMDLYKSYALHTCNTPFKPNSELGEEEISLSFPFNLILILSDQRRKRKPTE